MMRWFAFWLHCVASFAPLPLHPKAPQEELQSRLKVQQQLINGFTPEFWPPAGAVFPSPVSALSNVRQTTVSDVYQLAHAPPRYVVKPALTEAIALPSPEEARELPTARDRRLPAGAWDDDSPDEGKRSRVIRVVREQVEETQAKEEAQPREENQPREEPKPKEDDAIEGELEARLDQLLALVEGLGSKTDNIESRLGEAHYSELEEGLARVQEALETANANTEKLEGKIDELSGSVALLLKPSREAESLIPEPSPIRRPRKAKVAVEPPSQVRESDSVQVVLNKILHYLNGELVALPQAVDDEQSSPQQSIPEQLPQEPARHSHAAPPGTASALNLHNLQHLVKALKKKDADLAVLSKTSSFLKGQTYHASQSVARTPKRASHNHLSQQLHRQRPSEQMLLQRSEMSKSEVPKKPLEAIPKTPLKQLNELTEEEVQREQAADLLREERTEHDWLSQKAPF